MFNWAKPCLSLGIACQIVILFVGCQDIELKDADSIVEAELLEIKGGIPQNINYKYVFIMKYRVLSGDIEEDTEIYVGHLDPVPDKFVVGDVHQLALEPDLFTIYDGGIVNRYFDQNISSPYLVVGMK